LQALGVGRDTGELGKFLLLSEVTETTMDDVKPFSSVDGFLAIAEEQTAGRGGNGATGSHIRVRAMFTFIVKNTEPKNKELFTKEVLTLVAFSAIKESLKLGDEFAFAFKLNHSVFIRNTKGDSSSSQQQDQEEDFDKIGGVLLEELSTGDGFAVGIGNSHDNTHHRIVKITIVAFVV